MILDSTALLEFSVDSGTAVEFVAEVINDDGSVLTPVVSYGASNGTTAVTLIAAPSASNHRTVRNVTIRKGTIYIASRDEL